MSPTISGCNLVTVDPSLIAMIHDPRSPVPVTCFRFLSSFSRALLSASRWGSTSLVISNAIGG